MKKLLTVVLLMSLMVLYGCQEKDNIINDSVPGVIEDIVVEDIINDEINFNENRYIDYTDESYITLDGSSTNYTITTSGTYELTGQIDETVIVDISEDEDIRLILNQVTITPSINSAILILSADDVEISVVEGSTNTLVDSTNYADLYQDYNATIYSNADLGINGLGTLNVVSNYNDAIQTKDDLMLVDLSLNITSKDDAIIGRDSISIDAVNLTIDALGDGLKTTNDENEMKGFTYIKSGTFDITALGDGIDSKNSIIIEDGTLTFDTENESIKSDQNIYIANGDYTIESLDDGIDSDQNIIINGGRFNINSDKDALHSNQSITLSNLSLVIHATDDAIHSDDVLTILSGTITITSSYEGLEGKSIFISGGTINIVATDDGINASDPEVEVVEGGIPNLQTDPTESTAIINISGGNLIIEAEDDGIDANGTFIMTGGTVVINGPVNGMQSAVDYDLKWIQEGGILIAVAGYGHETKVPSSESTQTTIVYNLEQTNHANQTFSLIDDQSVLYAFTPKKEYEVILISSPDLNLNSTYSISFNGEITGDLINGYYTLANVENDTIFATFNLDEIINTFNLEATSVTPFPGGNRPR